MKKTLALCFIHGFKGGESTFGDKYQFTEHLRGLVARQLPKIDVRVLVYPTYETRGDLGDCVSRLRDWLEEKVIDMEVAAGTPSPTVDPSVRVVLIGHSMGGIVAAETVIGLAAEKPIYTEDGIDKSATPAWNSLMFPRIQGVLAFDTPFLGISPGVVAHGAEGHYQTAQTAVAQLSSLGTLWAGKTAAAAPRSGPAVTAATSSSSSSSTTANSGWSTWGKVAMYAGAAGAVAAGGAAAWVNRDHISAGLSWASSHLEFVGCLARPEELRKRVACMVKLGDELDVGFVNVYTRLGQGAQTTKQAAGMVRSVLGRERTFCNVPSNMPGGRWVEAVNDRAADETLAHMSMFEPKGNPAYEKLSQDARDLIVQWLQNDWYESSSEAQSKPQAQAA